MYTKAAVLATSATSLPMWGPEGYRMVPLPNMVADFRDISSIGRKLDVERILENYTPTVFNIEGRPKDQITEIERQKIG